MAGSHDLDLPTLLCSDPIMKARVEALTQLADGLSDRVLVLDQNLNVLYANQAAWAGTPRPAPDGGPAKCYEALINRRDAYNVCPAATVFETREGVILSASLGGPDTACGMRRAVPLMSGTGDVGSVLVLFKDEPVRHMSDVGIADACTPDGEAAPESARLGALIGRSLPMQELFHMIRLVADSSATVSYRANAFWIRTIWSGNVGLRFWPRISPFRTAGSRLT